MKIIKKCIICNKNFSPDKNHPYQKICFKSSCKKTNKTLIENTNNCIDCGKKIRYIYKRCQRCYLIYNIGKNNSNYRLGRYSDNPNKCIDCNITISKEHFRCQSCARTGKLHPNYIHGRAYEPYSLDFNPKLREEIRKRDKYKCTQCGMTRKQHYKKYNRNLEVHHKDHDRQNCKESNLETRCKKCNIKDNQKFKRRLKHD